MLDRQQVLALGAILSWAAVGLPQLAAANPERLSPILQIEAQLNPPRPARIVPPIPAPALPEQIPVLPAPQELLPTPTTPTAPETPEISAKVFVRQIEVVGSTVFSTAELAEVTQPYINRSISFTELLQVRSAITQLYVSRGYVTSGAFVPPQTIENGRVTIQVLEGSLESINITGQRRLNPGYIRSRLALAATTPLNQARLLEGLQLLQLNPLIETLSADLQSGTRPGSSVLQVTVKEADSFNVEIGLNNGRSPSVGSFRRQIQFEHLGAARLGHPAGASGRREAKLAGKRHLLFTDLYAVLSD
jgi:hemolysin activation/secretion protein